MASTRILVTGASGLLGRAVMREFSKHDRWNVLGLAFSRTQKGFQKCDLTNKEQVKEVFKDFKPQFVLHCAAERRPDVVEKKEDATQALNVTATELLAKLAVETGAVLVYMSTDYVFDGRNPPYHVDSQPNPLNKYGQSKLEGEKVVLAASDNNIIVRIPILYGEVESLDESAVTILFSQVMNPQKLCKVCHHQRRYPTLTTEVAFILRQLLEKRIEDDSLTGIFHWSGKEMMTKYDMALAMAAAFSLSSSHLSPSTSPPPGTERPYDVQLDRSRMESLGIQSNIVFTQEIKKCLQPFIKK